MKKVIFSIILVIFLSSSVFAGKSARIIKISDGDTFIVLNENNQKVKLRLLWIDTPEKFSSRKLNKNAELCGVSKKRKRIVRLGKMATSYAKRYFKNSKNIEVDYYGRGYYGRRLALVYKKGNTQHNFDIIEDEYACIYKKAEYPHFGSITRKNKKGTKGIMGCGF